MEDLSHMIDPSTGLTGGESMSAGNTMTIPGVAMQAPGSRPVNPLPPGAEVDTPDLDIAPDRARTVLMNAHGAKAGD
jgi:hypothetical protein